MLFAFALPFRYVQSILGWVDMSTIAFKRNGFHYVVNVVAYVMCVLRLVWQFGVASC